MKILTSASFHLTYYTNIRLHEKLIEVFANLKQYIPVLKAQLLLKSPFGIVLRLADVAARKLLEANIPSSDYTHR